MSIGNNIYKLRTAENMSQGDLADRIDVSRQSVSKWETDAAVPDLDKLMKLCDVFGVSLDEITGRVADRQDNIEAVERKKHPSAQTIIGYVLFAFSLLLALIPFILGDCIFLLAIAPSFTVSGLLCLFAKEKAFYWCIWSLLAPIVIALPFLTDGFMDGTFVFSLIAGTVAAAVIMFFVARAVFRDTVIGTSAKKTLLLILAWTVPIALFAFVLCIHTVTMPRFIVHNSGKLTVAIGVAYYALTALLETYSVYYFKNLKKR